MTSPCHAHEWSQLVYFVKVFHIIVFLNGFTVERDTAIKGNKLHIHRVLQLCSVFFMLYIILQCFSTLVREKDILLSCILCMWINDNKLT